MPLALIVLMLNTHHAILQIEILSSHQPELSVAKPQSNSLVPKLGTKSQMHLRKLHLENPFQNN